MLQSVAPLRTLFISAFVLLAGLLSGQVRAHGPIAINGNAAEWMAGFGTSGCPALVGFDGDQFFSTSFGCTTSNAPGAEQIWSDSSNDQRIDHWNGTETSICGNSASRWTATISTSCCALPISPAALHRIFRWRLHPPRSAPAIPLCLTIWRRTPVSTGFAWSRPAPVPRAIGRTASPSPPRVRASAAPPMTCGKSRYPEAR